MSSKNIDTLANRRFLCNKPKQSNMDLIINTQNNTTNVNNTNNKNIITHNNTYNFLSLYILVYIFICFFNNFNR